MMTLLATELCGNSDWFDAARLAIILIFLELSQRMGTSICTADHAAPDYYIVPDAKRKPRPKYNCKEQMEMILKYWVRVLSFDLFPPEISSVIVYRFTYHARMDRIHRFPFFIEEESHYAPIKVSVVGSTIAGKTCMVKRFCKNKFYTFYITLNIFSKQ